jgi:L-gulonolactone oxidase
MTCLGSVSDPTLGGVIATASHGSGINFGIISTQVMAVTLMLADGSRITCSRTQHCDLFLATLCGLGATGIIISVQLEVEPAFRLKDVQESLPFDYLMEGLDSLSASAEHIRYTWYPVTDTVRCSFADRTQEVSPLTSVRFNGCSSHATCFCSQKSPQATGGLRLLKSK